MSWPEAPAETEAKQILAALEEQEHRLNLLTDAVNGLGANIQWIIDNVQGIFQMLGNPGMISQMMGALNAGPDAFAATLGGGFPGSESAADSNGS
jgi:hypothetical protein